ncbi:MAG: CHASE domain-containing protein [Candidatus Pacebacteria bacterium]|nr:CHASE domain-containing protein [Candidatus Paceibacterota bacterium]
MSINKRNLILPRILSWGSLILFLSASVVSSIMIKNNLEEQGRLALENKAQLIQQMINDSFDTYTVRQPVATRALFDSSDYVSAKEFHDFYSSIDVKKNFPGISYVGFSRYVKNSEEGNLIKEMRLEEGHDLENFNIFPGTNNNFIAPIVYLEPDDNRINTAIGFDVLSEPNRSEAIGESIDSGKFILSEKVTVYPSEKLGFIGYLPVYNKKINASSTVEEKRSNVYGIISTVFEIDSLFGNFSEALNSLVLEYLDIEVFEDSDISDNGLLYDYFPTKGKITNSENFSAEVKKSLSLGRKEFTLVVSSTAGLISPSFKIMPYILLAVGCIFGLFLFLIFNLAGSVYIRAYKLADTMTKNFRESEEKYRLIFMDSKDAIMTSSPEEGFLSGNPATIKLFGCRDEKEFISMAPYDLSPEYQPDGTPSKQKALKMMNLAMDKGSAFFEWTHKKVNGTEFPATVLLSRIEIGGKKFLQATVRDITKEKEAENAKSEFVSLASHQLRTPLTATKWLIELLLEEKRGKLTEGQRDLLKEVHGSNEGLISLVNDLLSVNKMEMGKLVVSPKNLDLIDLSKKIVKENEIFCSQSQKIIFSSQKEFLNVFIDSLLYTQALQNLIANAIIYGGKETDIIVSIKNNDKEAEVSVKNFGPSIPKEDQAKMFEKFFRGERAKKENVRGTGLGLYMVKESVEANKGRVWMESNEKETTFYFTVPINGSNSVIKDKIASK